MLYFWVKQVHVWSVGASFVLFLARGTWVAAGRPLPQHLAFRVLPHAVDTILLTSALWLTTIIAQYPFQQTWLTVKVLLLVAYIVLGHVALRRARSRAGRLLALAAAAGMFLSIYSVARFHHPLGALLLLGG